MKLLSALARLALLVPFTLWGLLLLWGNLLMGALLLWPCALGWRALWRSTRPGAVCEKKSALAWAGGVLLLYALGAAVILPKVADLLVYEREGRMKGSLSILRLAVEEYRQVNGRRPAELSFALKAIAQKPMSEPPMLWERSRLLRSPHAPGNSVVIGSTATAQDGGYWGFDPKTSEVFIDCTHTDSRSRLWTEY